MADSESKGKGGRRATITRGDVEAAVSDLLSEGKEPSERAVRRLLGRGSFTTIGPMLRKATTSAGAAEADGRAPVITELRARISELEAALASERSAREAAEADLEAERLAREAANKRIGALEAEAGRARADRKEARTQSERAAVCENKLKGASKELASANAKLEAGLVDKGKLEAVIAERESEIRRLKEQFQRYKGEVGKAFEEARRAGWDHDEVMRRNQELASSNSALRQAVERARGSASELSGRVKELEGELVRHGLRPPRA